MEKLDLIMVHKVTVILMWIIKHKIRKLKILKRGYQRFNLYFDTTESRAIYDSHKNLYKSTKRNLNHIQLPCSVINESNAWRELIPQNLNNEVDFDIFTWKDVERNPLMIKT